MILKTYKDVYKNVAEKLNLNENVVTLLGDFLYTELGRSLDNYEHRITYVYGLGDFKFRKKKSINYIKKVETVKHGIERFRKWEVPEEEKIEFRIEKMKNLVKEWDEFYEQKQNFKLKKQEYYASGDIQESGEDLGRVKEQDI